MEVALLISKATVSLVEGIKTAVAFNLIFELYYFTCIKCSLLLSPFAFKQCRKAKGLGSRTLVLSLDVMTPCVTPVTELDSGLFLPH